MILKTTSRVARWGRLLFLPYFGCSRPHLSDLKKLALRFTSAGLLFFSIIPFSNAMQLSSDTTIATAGYYQLSWKGKEKNIQLQESATADFQSTRLIYKGADRARVVSGKPDGDYFYRILTTDKNKPGVSNTVKVIVQHHPLKNAILFFITGLIVFIAILTLIINGSRREA